MKNILRFLMIFSIASATFGITPEKCLSNDYDSIKSLKIEDITFGMPKIAYSTAKMASDSINSVERRGCCSWHRGVCGCSAEGRAICCDGQLSPTCGCD